MAGAASCRELTSSAQDTIQNPKSPSKSQSGDGAFLGERGEPGGAPATWRFLCATSAPHPAAPRDTADTSRTPCSEKRLPLRSLWGSPFLFSFLPPFLPSPVPSVSGRCAAGGARGTPERLGTAGLGLARPGTAGLGAAARQAEAGPNFGSSAGPRAARRGVCGCRYRRLLLPTRAERSPVI